MLNYRILAEVLSELLFNIITQPSKGYPTLQGLPNTPRLDNSPSVGSSPSVWNLQVVLWTFNPVFGVAGDCMGFAQVGRPFMRGFSYIR